MSGILSSVYALAIAVQADANTRATLDADDRYPCANLRPGGQSYTIDNPESTGTIHRPGAEVLGRDANDSFDFLMRGPGGASIPAADAYVPGRVLRGAGFAEVREATGIASEALGGSSSNSGVTTTVILGASASSTDGAYVGFVIQFSDIGGGSGSGSLSQIIAYNGSTKVATLGEKLATLPAEEYTIPPQLVYRLDEDAAQLYLTHQFWLHKKLYKRQHGVVGTLNLTVPTSNRSNVALPLMNVSLQAEIDDADDDSDAASPAVAAQGSTPPFRNGKFVLNGVAIGGQSMTYQHGIRTGFPPNPNKPNGADAGCIVETRRSVALNLNETLISEQDRNALAVAQTSVSLMAAYGNVAGKTIYFCVPAGRLDYSNPDNGGDFVTNNTQLLIDNAEKAVCLAFPYYS